MEVNNPDSLNFQFKVKKKNIRNIPRIYISLLRLNDIITHYRYLICLIMKMQSP